MKTTISSTATIWVKLLPFVLSLPVVVLLSASAMFIQPALILALGAIQLGFLIYVGLIRKEFLVSTSMHRSPFKKPGPSESIKGQGAMIAAAAYIVISLALFFLSYVIASSR